MKWFMTTEAFGKAAPIKPFLQLRIPETLLRLTLAGAEN
jgi:hypothetical protein